jgi:hypothetical protein
LINEKAWLLHLIAFYLFNLEKIAQIFCKL